MSTLTVGQQAPDFTGINQHNETIRLQDFAGKKVILYFYPKDNTPGCTVEANNLNANFEILTQKGFAIVGVSPDSVQSHCSFIAKYNLQFNLIADTDKTILKTYNAWGEKKMYGKSYEGVLRTTYVINEQGIISAIITKVDTKNHTEQILKELE
ncbi:MAG TPA: thioredoxin-dependent thiol peroxidase [Bacteroidales bacterium]|nr:MAG: putative peroxiredoxin bcp [Bacteroidetes bacterium ADurb.Bin217]HPM12331.1 thioredoxin-dependent thiol peroxidase [Bacteroidales bacterium]